MNGRHRWTWAAAVFGVALGLVSSPSPAHATYPGSNAEIAYWDATFRAVDPDGTNDRAYIPIHFPQELSFANDGTHAIVSNYGRLAPRIVLVDLVAHTRTPVLRTRHAPTPSIASVAISPDGSSVVFCDDEFHGNLWTVAIDGSSLTEIAKGYCFGDWGVDGRIVASKIRSDGERLITSMDADGRKRTIVVTLPPVKRAWRGGSFDLRPSWAPDASAVVFGAQRRRSHPEIWWVASDGSNLHRLTHTTLSEFDPVVSPDGLRIVYARRNGIYANELWTMDADGSNQSLLLIRPSGQEFPLAWRAT